MSTYIFLTDNFSEETRYFAISADRIETLQLHETYDKFGQQVGHDNAGNYHFDNCYSEAIKDCNMALVTAGLLNNKDEISWVLDGDVSNVEDLYGENEGCNKEAVEDFAKKWRSEHETLTECEGFDYWDGHNWKTVTTQIEFGEPSHQVIEDEKMIAELNEAIENMEEKEKGFGKTIFLSGDYTIISTQFASDWAEYTIMPTCEYSL